MANELQGMMDGNHSPPSLKWSPITNYENTVQYTKSIYVHNKLYGTLQSNVCASISGIFPTFHPSRMSTETQSKILMSLHGGATLNPQAHRR